MNTKLQNTMTRGETIFGWIYVFLNQLAIPFALVIGCFLLKIEINDMQLNMAYFTLNFLLIILVFHKFLLKSLRQMISDYNNFLFTCAIGFAIYWIANMAVGLVIMFVDPDFANANDAYLQNMSQDGFWILFVGTVFLVPLTEEVLYRGILFGTLDAFSRPLAYVVSVLIFSAIHVVGYIGTEGFTLATALISLLQYIPASVCLAWAYSKTDSIFASTFIHMAVNFIGMMAMR